MRIAGCKKMRFALEINSLYDPEYWGVDSFLDIMNPDILPPDRFWGVAMELLEDWGLGGFESSFGPGSYQGAKAVFGSGARFKDALDAHRLHMVSGFYHGLFDEKPCSADYTGKWKQPWRQRAIFREVEAYADFLAEAGSSVMTIGLPMRKSRDASRPEFVDAEFYKTLAELLHQIAYRIGKKGVRLALHPEGNSSFWLKRDIDTLLAFTDPMYVDFCPDTGNIRAGGNDPAWVCGAHRERMTLFHWKDCSAELPRDLPTEGIIFQRHAPYFCTVGKGMMDHAAWMKLLRDIQFQGWAVLELPGLGRFQEILYALQFLQQTILPLYDC